MSIETTPCLVCGCSDCTPRFSLRDWAYELPGEFTLVKCRACEHLYQTPRPTQSSISTYYPQAYEPFRTAIAEGPHWLLRAWKHIQLRSRCRQVAHIRQAGRLLDVGASTGLFLNEMRRYGNWELSGVEVNARAAQYARDTFGLEMFNCQIEDAPWPDSSFDIITMWDVLEHLPNPKRALSKMRRLLCEGGSILFSVPNADSIDALLFGKYWIGLDAPRHMSVFRLASIKRLLFETDFDIESAYCFYGRYTTFALSLRQWLHSTFHKSLLRDSIEEIIFSPIWRYLTLPYFWTLDKLNRGAIITIRARPTTRQ